MVLADYAAAFRSRKIGLLLLLGFSSGLPLALTAARCRPGSRQKCRHRRHRLVRPGGPALHLQVPLGALHGPLCAVVSGRRRGWLLITQLLLAAAIAFMGTLSPLDSVWLLGATAFAVALLSPRRTSCSTRCARTGWRARKGVPAPRVSVFGYRIAMLVSGAGV
jgi:PAT family beta-lactamase induction signal transducer AmpG